ncbi:hypothetical protein Tco_0257431 [Tanacetum coccineum]
MHIVATKDPSPLDKSLETLLNQLEQDVSSKLMAEMCMFALPTLRDMLKKDGIDSKESLHQWRRDSDHAGCLDLRKSTSGGIQFLGGDKLVSWSSKKQDCTSMFSEEEYVFICMLDKLYGRLGMRCLTPDELEVSAFESA